MISEFVCYERSQIARIRAGIDEPIVAFLSFSASGRRRRSQKCHGMHRICDKLCRR